MKVIHVCNHFYPCIGGIEKSVYDICIQLTKAGHTSDVICLNTCSNSKEALARHTGHRKINIFRIPYLNLRFYKVAPGILKIIKNYDVVHVHGLGFFADYLASTRHIHNKPLVLSTHGGIFHTKRIKRLKSIYFGLYGKAVLRSFDRIIAVSQEDRKLFMKIAEKGKIEVIPNGIDYHFFASIKRKPDKSMLVFIGRISKNKRIDRLIDMMHFLTKTNPRVRLYIIGNNWEGLRKQLERRASEKKLDKNVFFTGESTESQLRSYLSRAGFFVSASEYEGFGISVVEAMACGIVPILNDMPQFRNLVSDGKDGFLVNFSSPRKAALKINYVMQADTVHIQKKAKSRSQDFDLGRIMGKLYSTYRAVLE